MKTGYRCLIVLMSVLIAKGVYQKQQVNSKTNLVEQTYKRMEFIKPKTWEDILKELNADVEAKIKSDNANVNKTRIKSSAKANYNSVKHL